MENSIWKQCKSKKRYRDEHFANYYRRIFEQERGVKLDYYWCPYCKGFHLTSSEFVFNRFVKKEIDMEIVAG